MWILIYFIFVLILSTYFAYKLDKSGKLPTNDLEFMFLTPGMLILCFIEKIRKN